MSCITWDPPRNECVRPWRDPLRLFNPLQLQHSHMPGITGLRAWPGAEGDMTPQRTASSSCKPREPGSAAGRRMGAADVQHSGHKAGAGGQLHCARHGLRALPPRLRLAALWQPHLPPPQPCHSPRLCGYSHWCVPCTEPVGSLLPDCCLTVASLLPDFCEPDSTACLRS